MSEPQLEPSSRSKLFEESGDPDSKDETIAALEKDLTDLSNRLHEERFIWILILIILFDALIFSQMENWTAPIVIGILELVGIVIMADRCKVDTVAPLIDRFFGFVHRAANTQDETRN